MKNDQTTHVVIQCEPAALDKKSAAAFCGVSVSTIDRALRSETEKLSYVKLESKVLFLPDDLRRWLMTRRKEAA